MLFDHFEEMGQHTSIDELLDRWVLEAHDFSEANHSAMLLYDVAFSDEIEQLGKLFNTVGLGKKAELGMSTC